jgi:hypothetical protein
MTSWTAVGHDNSFLVAILEELSIRMARMHSSYLLSHLDESVFSTLTRPD